MKVNDIDHESLPESKTCDKNEAPIGYYAVPKPAYDVNKGNICQQCDWRKSCRDKTTDLLAFGHRCMSATVVAGRDGKSYRRSDRCSVIFKLNPSAE